MGGADSHEAFGRWLKKFRGKRTQEGLAGRLGVDQPKVSKAERGELSEATARAYDRLCSAEGATTPGEVLDRWRTLGRVPPRGTPAQGAHPRVDVAALAQAGGGLVVVLPLPGEPQLAELLADMAGERTLALPGGPYRVIVSTGEVADADRRGLLHVATTPVVAAALDRADKASRAISAARLDPWTLDELTQDAVTVAETYWSTPLAQLLPEVIARWEQCADMLEQSLIGKTCERVVQLAGTYAYYAARIGGHTGTRRLASGFGTLAEQYAEISGDPLLVGSVAGFRSFQAFDAARYAEAALPVRGRGGDGPAVGAVRVCGGA